MFESDEMYYLDDWLQLKPLIESCDFIKMATLMNEINTYDQHLVHHVD